MNHSVLARQPLIVSIFIAVLAVVYLGSAASAWPEPYHEHVCFSAAETRDKIAAHGLSEPFHAMRSAAGHLQAEMLGLKLCRLSEKLVYELSLLRHDGHVIHLYIDAKTGQAMGHED